MATQSDIQSGVEGCWTMGRENILTDQSTPKATGSRTAFVDRGRETSGEYWMTEMMEQ